jgi:hypothetical protein
MWFASFAPAVAGAGGIAARARQWREKWNAHQRFHFSKIWRRRRSPLVEVV